jgi:hypothetical protein
LFSGGVITRFDILTGKQSAQNVMPSLKNNSLHARRILWSADRSRFYNLQLLEFNSEAPIGWVVDQRDARTLESMGTFVANCVDVGLRGDRIGLHPLENPRRQQALAQTIRAAFIECQPLPTFTLTELKALEASSKADSPLSWMQLPDSRLVHHRSDGLFYLGLATSPPGSTAFDRTGAELSKRQGSADSNRSCGALGWSLGWPDPRRRYARPLECIEWGSYAPGQAPLRDSKLGFSRCQMASIRGVMTIGSQCFATTAASVHFSLETRRGRG